MERINAEIEARVAREQAEYEAKQAEIKAQKAISQHVGEVGEKVEMQCVYVKSGSWEQPSFKGWGQIRCIYIHLKILTVINSFGKLKKVYRWNTGAP